MAVGRLRNLEISLEPIPGCRSSLWGLEVELVTDGKLCRAILLALYAYRVPPQSILLTAPTVEIVNLNNLSAISACCGDARVFTIVRGVGAAKQDFSWSIKMLRSADKFEELSVPIWMTNNVIWWSWQDGEPLVLYV